VSEEAVAEEMPATEIDGSFVPIQRAGVTCVELDGEAVVLAEGSASPHYLNVTGTLLWNTFDGSATVEELAKDFAEAFEVDLDVMRTDILTATQEIGRAGLLEGVAYEPPPEPSYADPTGFSVGEPLPELRAPDLEGNEVSLADLRGKQMLLVNWSASCGFCTRIAPELAELQPDLRARGVEMVFLTFGAVEANRAMLDEFGLDPRVLVLDPSENEVFPSVGTPSAYIVDAEGKVASELKVGANAVPDLARTAAGASINAVGRDDQPL
jgi:peroxiredoxin